MSDTLLPNNATPQEVALDQTTARVGGVEVPTRSIWDPETCPADALPWLAWAFSVDRWDTEWSVEQKRAIIAASLRLHKRKGTPAAVKEVVELIFSGGDVVEPWQAADLDAHQFKIVTTGLLESAEAYDDLIRLVDAAKPVRSWLVAVQIKRSATSALTWASYARTGGEMLVLGRLNVGVEDYGLNVGTGLHRARTTEVSPAGVSISLPDFDLLLGGGYHYAKTMTIQPRST
jgi:phage tail P2-like protein